MARNSIPDDLKELIRRQVQLRQQIVAFKTIAQLAGVSVRAVLKAARKARNGR